MRINILSHLTEKHTRTVAPTHDDWPMLSQTATIEHQPHQQQPPPSSASPFNSSSSTSTRPNSVPADGDASARRDASPSPSASSPIDRCADPSHCITLASLEHFKLTLSVDQAWAVIHQTVLLYRQALAERPLPVPVSTQQLCLHPDGSVHVAADATIELASSERDILNHIGFVVYGALVPSSDLSTELTAELDSLIATICAEDEPDDDDGVRTLDAVLGVCMQRINQEDADDCRSHYRAVCRALASEVIELWAFLRKVCKNETESPGHSSVPRALGAPTTAGSPSELGSSIGSGPPSNPDVPKFGFVEWTRFWLQVVEELRRGVRLKKSNAVRPARVFELTPYEILMEDINAQNYELRKVMVDGELPAERLRPVRHDAHSVILDFIRSRPPLRRAADRRLPPAPLVEPTPRERLLDEIRRHGGGTTKLRATETARARRLIAMDQSLLDDDEFVPPPPIRTVGAMFVAPVTNGRRLIPVDMSLFDDDADDAEMDATYARKSPEPPTVVHRRKTQTGGQQHRTSKRRHTIVGCQSNGDLSTASGGQRAPAADVRPEPQRTVTTMNPLNPMNGLTEQALAEWTAMPLTDDDDRSTSESDDMRIDDDDRDDEVMRDVSGQPPPAGDVRRPTLAAPDDDDVPHATPAELPEHQTDRLTLSLDEIVHIRSVMTKAELEGLPVGVQVKEDVERRKVCFLCLRTRFSMFRQWGVQCKLCQRTVCAKCHTKMRIPTEHFRNVPVMLLSASLVGSPVTAERAGAPDDDGPRSLPAYAPNALTGSAPSTPRMFGRAAAPSVGHAVGNGTTAATVRGAASALQRHQDADRMSRSMDAEALLASGAGSACSTVGHHANASLMNGLPPRSPASRSQPNTLDRQASSRFARAFNRTHSQAANHVERDVLRGELSSVCNDCRDLVNNICRSSKQTRSSARNKALRKMTLDLSPVYK